MYYHICTNFQGTYVNFVDINKLAIFKFARELAASARTCLRYVFLCSSLAILQLLNYVYIHMSSIFYIVKILWLKAPD